MAKSNPPVLPRQFCMTALFMPPLDAIAKGGRFFYESDSYAIVSDVSIDATSFDELKILGPNLRPSDSDKVAASVLTALYLTPN